MQSTAPRRTRQEHHGPDRVLLRIKEAQEALGLSRTKLYQLMADGTLPHVKLGSSLRFRPEDLEELADSHVRRNTHETA